MKMDSDLCAVFGLYLMASIDQDAVATLDSDGVMAISSAQVEAVRLDVKAAADSDGVPATAGHCRRSTQIRLQCLAGMGRL
jgi:hypothetical protein